MKKIFTLIAALAVTLTSSAQIASNYSLITHPGAGAGGANVSATQVGLGMTLFGSSQNYSVTGLYWLAEKITVPASGWIIDSLVTVAYQTNSGNVSTITGLYCYIAPDSASMPSNTITIGSKSTNAMAYTNWTGIYRTPSETALTDVARPIMKIKSNLTGFVPAGTYWVVWSAKGSLASGPWNPPVTILGSTTTGNAMQYTPTGWANSMDGTNAQGMPYKLYGKIATGMQKPEVTVSSVAVYPNPVVSSASVKIEFANNSDLTANDVTFVVYDQLGREVLNYSNITSTTFSIERGELSAGSYTYKVSNKHTGASLKTDKLVIQ